MKSKFLPIVLAITAALTFSAFAQTGSAGSPSSAAATTPPSAPSAAAPAASAPVSLTGTKVGTINIEGAIFGCNEGRRDMEALQKKLEPRSSELKTQNEELDTLKKQLSTQGDKLNEEAASNLKKQIDTKQKSFDRSYQDFQEEVNNQQQEVASRILSKMAPLIMKYASENGYGMILDTSKQWPQSPVLVAGEGVDITKNVVDAYNTQSGVAAPTAATGGTKPAPRAPASTTPKLATPKPSEAPKQ